MVASSYETQAPPSSETVLRIDHAVISPSNLSEASTTSLPSLPSSCSMVSPPSPQFLPLTENILSMHDIKSTLAASSEQQLHQQPSFSLSTASPHHKYFQSGSKVPPMIDGLAKVNSMERFCFFAAGIVVGFIARAAGEKRALVAFAWTVSLIIILLLLLAAAASVKASSTTAITTTATMTDNSAATRTAGDCLRNSVPFYAVAAAHGLGGVLAVAAASIIIEVVKGTLPGATLATCVLAPLFVLAAVFLSNAFFLRRQNSLRRSLPTFVSSFQNPGDIDTDSACSDNSAMSSLKIEDFENRRSSGSGVMLCAGIEALREKGGPTFEKEEKSPIDLF